MTRAMFLVCAVAPAGQHPLVPRTSTVPPDPERTQTTWGSVIDGTSDPAAPPTLAGPALHLSAGGTDVTVRGPVAVQAPFRVRAAFRAHQSEADHSLEAGRRIAGARAQAVQGDHR